MGSKPKLVKFEATKSSGNVSALVMMPEQPSAFLLFAHGAGAGMRHGFMDAMAHSLSLHGIATLRYQFPYAEQGLRRPDPKPILLATVRSAVAHAHKLRDGLPLFAGGKSMGGRMTSLAASDDMLPDVRGIVFFGFPLHPAGQPSVERSEHLFKVRQPMLFLQGTRDTLADLTLLRPVCSKLGHRATLVEIDQADHSFHVPKTSGRTDDDVRTLLAHTTADWVAGLET